MPQASEEQRLLMLKWFGDPISDEGPIMFLRSHGFVMHPNAPGYWKPPVDSYTVSRDEWECLNFLTGEWDHGGILTEAGYQHFMNKAVPGQTLPVKGPSPVPVTDREAFIKIAEEINGEGYQVSVTGPTPLPKEPYKLKHYGSMWQCAKCRAWWGTSYWEPYETLVCLECGHKVPRDSGLPPWPLTTRGPFHVMPDSLPMLYSAMVAVNASGDTENPYSLPASLFVGALAELTGDALAAIDQDLARFYVQYGSSMFSEFVSGDQNVVDKRLAELPFANHHNVGIRQAHKLLNSWLEGFEL